MKIQLTTGLAIGLALSLVGNAVLGIGWARSSAAAEANCRADMVEAARIAIVRERKRAADAESESVAISTVTHAEGLAETRGAQGRTHARSQAINAVPVTGQCRMPVGLPSQQPAVDEANAAAGF